MSEWNEFAARDEARANAEQDELDQLRAALAAANARAEEAEAKIARYEALETTCRSKHRHATIHDAYMCDLATARAEAAEAQLADMLPNFYREVCAEAERIMASSGMVSGAHWNAMRIVIERRGVRPEVQP